MKFYSSTNSGEKGFTLIEMVVSIALFIVVAMVAIGALLKVLDANKKSQSLKTTINNINFAMDAMTREMRVGTKYYCVEGNNPSSIPATLPGAQECHTTGGSPWIVAFESSKPHTDDDGTKCNLIYAYWYDGTSLRKWEQKDCDEDSGPNKYHHVISGGQAGGDDIFIKFDSAVMRVVNVPLPSGSQSYAQVRFKGYAGERERTRSTFDFQTTISQRLID